MKLYDSNFAPNPRRVRIFLAEKGISVPAVAMDMAAGEHLKPAFRSINPRCTLPVLELDDGRTLDESISICRWFEARQPEPNMFGRDAWEIAEIDQWHRRIEFDGYINIAHVLRNRAPSFADRALPGDDVAVPQIPELAARGEALAQAWYGALDRRLDGREFIVTDRLTIADISAFVAVDFARWARISPDAEAFPHLTAWHGRMTARPSAGA